MPTSSKFLSKKFLLWTLGVVVCIIILGITTFLLGKRFAGQILNEVVQRETNGYYALTFESIDFDVLERRFRVNDLALSVDTTKDMQALGIRNAYDVRFQELIIDLESLGEFYLNKELLMKSVRVIDPDIQMVPLGPPQEEKTFSLQAGNLYQAISDYLKVLKIDYFRIQEGNLQYGSNQFSLGNIDFLVKNLLMDSVQRSTNVFYSETIRLEISNQKFHLPDNIHEVTFDRFILSTQDSILSFENFRVRPVEGVGVTFEGDNDVNVYDIHVPKLSFKGLDYVSAYQNNHLIIDELELQEPTVFIDDETHAARADKDKDNSLLNLLFQVFGAIDVGKLSINKAHVDLKANAGPKSQRFKAEESDIVFYNIHLDTSNFRFDSRYTYFDDIELDIHNYTYLLPDSAHTVRFDRLSINSFDSEIRLDSVRVTHERAGNEAKLLIDVDLPSLVLKNIDYHRAMREKVLNMGHLNISDVSVSVRNTGSSKNRDPLNLSKLYQQMLPVFREVTLDKIDFKNINLSLPKGVYFGDIDLLFQDVKFNAASRKVSNLYQRADVVISDFRFDQDSIKLLGSRLHSDHSLSTYHLLDWDVAINTSNTSVNVSFDSLFVSGMNVDSLFEGNYKTFTRAVLTNPDISFSIEERKDTTRKPNGFNLGVEKELVLKGGKVKGNLGPLTIAADSIHADVFVGDSTAFRKLAVRNIALELPEENHLVHVAVWSFDTLDGHMYFKKLKVAPIDDSDTSKVQLELDVQQLSLLDFEQAEFFDNNHLFASDIFAEAPNVRLLHLPNRAKKDTTKVKKKFTMAVDRIRVADGDFFLGATGPLDSLEVAGFTSTFRGVKFPRKDPFDSGAFLYSDSLSFAIRELIPYLSSQDTLLFENIHFENEKGNLNIDSIKYVKFDQSLRLELPKLHFNRLDVKALYQEGKFQVDTLTIRSLEGMNVQQKSKGKAEPFATPISIQHLEVTDLNWIYQDTTTGKSFAFNNINIFSDQLIMEDTFDLENIPSYVGKLNLSGGPFELSASENYGIRLDRYEVSYPKSEVKLTGFNLVPKYSKEEFSANLELQNDWFDVSVKDITLSKIDVIKAVRDQNYVVGKVAISGVDALIYRDKGVPFPEDQVRSLPQSDLRAIAPKFRIDTVAIGGRLRYQEKPENNLNYGEISFDDLEGQLLNVKNLNIAPKDIMKLNATGKLMESGKFKVTASFLMDHPYDRFSFSGWVRDFPLDSMNRMLGPVGNINIKSGFTESLDFDFVANDSLARGEMKFKYDDLKILILNKQTHDKHGLGQGIKTFFANTFVVKNKNPSFLVFARKGVIFQARDTSRAVFNYWGKALLSGAISSIGIHKSDKAAKRFEKKVEDQ